jgi:PAS domain S-box-containing protein
VADRERYDDELQLQVEKFMDINELRKARLRLAEMEAIEASILDAITQAVMGIDKRHIIFANKAVETVFGWKPEELMGKNSRILYRNDEEYERIGREFYSLHGKDKNHVGEVTCRRKDGTDIICRISASAIGKFIGDKRITVVYEDITKTKKANQKLLGYYNKLRSLTAELSLTEERERRHIAGELHDGIIQTLAMTKMKLETMQKEASSSSLAEPLKEVIGNMNQLIQETRSLILDLSPPAIYILGLEAALDGLVEQFEKKNNIGVFFEKNDVKDLDKEVAFLLFRSTQELLRNVVKHAEAKNVVVSISRRDDYVVVTVEDDGIGLSNRDFNTDRSKGFGLFSIKERLDYLGGCLTIDSEIGRGTCVSMSILPKVLEKKRRKL